MARSIQVRSCGREPIQAADKAARPSGGTRDSELKAVGSFSGRDAESNHQRKNLVPKALPDHSQAWRRLVQGVLLALNAWIGFRFIQFVLYFETGGQSLHVSRPPGVEGWIPIAGLMNLKYLLSTGSVPSVHPAAMFLLIAFLAISFLFRKAFCSWLCPIGTISEALWKLGKRLFKRNWRLPRWADLPLRGVKYLLLAFFVYAVAGMTPAAIEAFLSSPYGLVADVKMLHFFRTLGLTAGITIAVLGVLSICLQNFWCRYLCPYGALTGLAAVFSPARVRRDRQFCIDCGKCRRACPALLPVDTRISIMSAECTGCLECVAACPAEDALHVSFGPKRRLAPWMLAAGMAAVFFGIIAYAQWNGTWGSNIPDSTYQMLIPHLDLLNHP